MRTVAVCDSSAMRGLQELGDGRKERRHVQRLGEELIASGLERPLSVAMHGMRGERDDDRGLEFRQRSQRADYRPPIDLRKRHVEEDEVRLVYASLLQRGTSIAGL